jgi:hypothetical protein
MKTLPAAAALVISGAMTTHAADIFTCGAIGYARHDGRVERVCSDPVTTHWRKLGNGLSALVTDAEQSDGLHLMLTMEKGVGENAAIERFEAALAAGRSATISIPGVVGEAGERIVLTSAGGRLQIAKLPAAVPPSD